MIARRQLMLAAGASAIAANAGGLISYGVDSGESYRRAAVFVDKILKGAPPGELPVEEPAAFRSVVNLKVAKALGISVPHSILLQASRVIE